MKLFAPFLLAALIFASCESTGAREVQKFREDGLPVWVDETFTSPKGLWAGYNAEKGYYASGHALYADTSAATKAAELDATKRLISMLSEQDKAHRTVKTLYGAEKVDRFVAEDGTVYVLMFISRKNAERSL